VGIPDAVLVAHGVLPWIGLPLWLPDTEPDAAGFMAVEGAKAQDAGLITRALPDTVRDTAEWLAARTNTGAWQHVLTADAERRVLDSAKATDAAESA
jgi:2'-hydroxyisoflavone reductase